MIIPERERWVRLSPLLDRLLDLDAEARAAHLDAIAAEDAALAAELASLLTDAARAVDAHFLSGWGELADASAPVAPPGLAGERIGAYVLEAPLGQGGTGVVWRARRADGRFEGTVAFKLLHLSLIGRTGALRFEREGAILARLEHPNIARLLDAGVTSIGQPYLVLERVDGAPIDRYCDSAHLGVDGRIGLFREVLDAVAHAHRHLVVHRDIKPNNILVGRDGHVKLLDFGIARLLQDDTGAADAAGAAAASAITRDGGQALTPHYASPEQLRGDALTTATDVYSLGVLLYQLLAGRHPTAPERATPAEVIHATLETDPGRLSTAVTVSGRLPPDVLARIASARDTSPQRLRHQLRGDLENIVAKALRKAPAERYSSVEAFSEDLRRCVCGEPIAARPATLAYRASRFVKRHRGAVAATVLTFAAILAGLVGTITQARRAEQQSAIAQREAESARRERDSALEQQQLLRGNNEFLQLLMRDAAGGDPGAIRKQLDRATALIRQTRFEQPIVKVALLRQIGGRYAEIGDVDAAARLLRQALASISGTALAAPGSAVPVNLACSLARYLEDMDELDAAAAELDRADRLMAAGASLSVPSRVECEVVRSFLETALGHLDRGIALARDALGRLEGAGIRAGEQHRVVTSALSRALLLSGRNAEALAIARPLLQESLAGQGRESMAFVRRSSIVTAATRQGGQPLAALALAQADEATAVQLLGAGRSDAAIDLEQGRVLLALGRDAEAAELLRRSAAAARASGNRELVLPAELAATEALLRAGQADAAARLFAEAAAERAAAVRSGRPAGIDALRLEGLLALQRGEAAAAAQALDAAQAALDAAGGSAHPLAFDVALARGTAALAAAAAAGRAAPEPALAEADRALAAARRSALQPERSSDVGRALLLRARSLAALGRNDAARSDAQAARVQLEATLGPAHADARAAAALASAPAR